jgi:hypothetical protein
MTDDYPEFCIERGCRECAPTCARCREHYCREGAAEGRAFPVEGWTAFCEQNCPACEYHIEGAEIDLFNALSRTGVPQHFLADLQRKGDFRCDLCGRVLEVQEQDETYVYVGCPKHLAGEEGHTSFSLTLAPRPDRYEIEGSEVLEKTVAPGNATSGRINMRVKDVGKRVKVVILDP